MRQSDSPALLLLLAAASPSNGLPLFHPRFELHRKGGRPPGSPDRPSSNTASNAASPRSSLIDSFLRKKEAQSPRFTAFGIDNREDAEGSEPESGTRSDASTQGSGAKLNMDSVAAATAAVASTPSPPSTSPSREKIGPATAGGAGGAGGATAAAASSGTASATTGSPLKSRYESFL
jgi:hypothetical protein